jgi:hypothetical protein
MSVSTIDLYSISTFPIEMFFNDTILSLGTAFGWEDSCQNFLITNWHNVSGRDPFTGKHLSNTGAEPNRFRVLWNKKGAFGIKFAAFEDIRDQNGRPLWWVHPRLGHRVDVVAIPITPNSDVEPYPINRMPNDDLLLAVGMDVFVLGYPFGIGPACLPIWKRGSIASEPATSSDDPHYILVDTASRPGMSGSPVIRRSWGTHMLRDGGVLGNLGAATTFVGVYSGRLTTNEPSDPQLGITWPVRLVEEIVSGKTRDA